MNTETTTPTLVDVADLIETRRSRETNVRRDITLRVRARANVTFPSSSVGPRKFLAAKPFIIAKLERVPLPTHMTETMKAISDAMKSGNSGVVVWRFANGEMVPYRKSKRARLKPLKENLTAATRAPEVSLSEWVANICAHPGLPFAKRLGARLQALLAISEEEQPEQAPPTLASVKSLVAFLAAHPGLAYPSVVLTQEGNVRVQWGGGPNNHFAVEFLGDGDVRFVIFAPDPRHPYKTVRVSGIATVDSVLRLAEPYDVRSWAEEVFVVEGAQ